MKLDMTESDHQKLDALIDGILNAYKDGEVTLEQARAALAHVICAAAVQDEPFEVRRWLEPERFDRWMEACRAARP